MTQTIINPSSLSIASGIAMWSCLLAIALLSLCSLHNQVAKHQISQRVSRGEGSLLDCYWPLALGIAGGHGTEQPAQEFPAALV